MKTILVNLRLLPAFLFILLLFSSNSFAKKARGAKQLLEEIDKKGIELSPEKREFLEKAVKEQEKIDAEYTKWQLEFPQKWKELKGKWKTVLVDKVQDANRIEVRSVHWKDEGKILHIISGNNKVKEFLNLLELTESSSMCACTGSALLVFLKEDRELAELSWHHGSSLRWHDGPWLGDALLSKKAIVELPRWFSAQGYSGFDDGVEDALKRYENDQTEKRIFVLVVAALAGGIILFIYGVYKISKRIFRGTKNVEAL